ncbi:glycosyltransferase [Temperatibacter marinus]|uniref:Glycosyltransferase n=1 Tax=Temperatibacter marinus TaxID=1456591 RepID=A0AA52H9W4_9PROT|nr:glycosyltransferase [Temperatibacter marinus]WND03339.1 glycosyltransferase [Temperatibacter marinus]
MTSPYLTANIIVRGSIAEGWGHVMRGVTIRDFLNHRNIKNRLILRLDTPLAQAFRAIDQGPFIIEDSDKNNDDIPSCDLCFLDQYTYTSVEIEKLQKKSMQLIVFDELAKINFTELFRTQDRIVRAQLLKQPRHSDKGKCKIYSGLPYFVIKRDYPDDIVHPPEKLWDVLIVLGGGAGHETIYENLAKQFKKTDPKGNLRISIVLGANSTPTFSNMISKIIPNATIHGYVGDLISLMRQSTVAIMSGGYSKYEAAYVGLPSIVFAVQDHQVEIAKEFCSAGGGIYAGEWHNPDSIEKAVTLVEQLLRSRQELERISTAAKKLIDGNGLDRILDKSLNHD